ncbi:cyclophilin 15, putative [Leishmania guyanensis]
MFFYPPPPAPHFLLSALTRIHGLPLVTRTPPNIANTTDTTPCRIPPSAMQVELSLLFPHTLKELPVSFFIPLLAQRPRTVANLFFMCSGQLPLPAELLAAVHLTESEVAYTTTDNAKAAGLLPLSNSAVVRIDKTSVIEIGSSTTKSIFGGFIPDEPVTLPADTAARGQSIATTMSSLKAGTLLYGNLGMPNTQACRYYILLESVTTPEQRREFAGFAPLGMVTSGLAELKRAASQTAVQPCTLMPKKKVVVSECRLQLDYAKLTSSSEAGASALPLGGPREGTSQNVGKRQPTNPHERVAGRVRRRDDDDEDEQTDARTAVESDDGNTSGPDAAPLRSTGFFRMSARFPRAVLASATGSPLKRRRAEAFVVGDDGIPALRTTAIAPGEQVNSDGTAAPFEFFKAQQDAFMNDIDCIKDAQRQRLNCKAGKKKKSQQAFASSSSRGWHASSQKHRSSGTRATGSRASSKSNAKKMVPRRY